MAGKQIFNILNPSIAIGNKAKLSLFTTEENWEFKKENILSKSKIRLF